MGECAGRQLDIPAGYICRACFSYSWRSPALCCAVLQLHSGVPHWVGRLYLPVVPSLQACQRTYTEMVSCPLQAGHATHAADPADVAQPPINRVSGTAGGSHGSAPAPSASGSEAAAGISMAVAHGSIPAQPPFRTQASGLNLPELVGA